MKSRQTPSTASASATYEGDDKGAQTQPIIVWLCLFMVVIFLIWAYFSSIEELTMANGKVVPSLRAQNIQSLEGGILAEMKVKEGDVVQQGQVLAVLDETRFRASYGEIDSKILSLKATTARLKSQMTGGALVFPEEVREDPDLVARETSLYESQRETLRSNVSGLMLTLELTKKELKLTEPLLEYGAASQVEILRLKQQVADLERKVNDQTNQFQVVARESYIKAMAELISQTKMNESRRDQLERTTITAPTNGVVKNIDVTTIGGVIAPGGYIMEIIPSEDKLLIEARVAPRDIAFIRPGMQALVKLTAYDYSIYGALTGHVERISPDTLVDETDKRVVYYRTYIRTDESSLVGKNGRTHPIKPGMVATVEILTGEKTVFQYLVKPLNKLNEALRER